MEIGSLRSVSKTRSCAIPPLIKNPSKLMGLALVGLSMSFPRRKRGSLDGRTVSKLTSSSSWGLRVIVGLSSRPAIYDTWPSTPLNVVELSLVNGMPACLHRPCVMMVVAAPVSKTALSLTPLIIMGSR